MTVSDGLERREIWRLTVRRSLAIADIVAESSVGALLAVRYGEEFNLLDFSQTPDDGARIEGFSRLYKELTESEPNEDVDAYLVASRLQHPRPFSFAVCNRADLGAPGAQEFVLFVLETMRSYVLKNAFIDSAGRPFGELMPPPHPEG